MADGTGKAHTGLALGPRIGCAAQSKEEKEGIHHDHRDIVQPPSLHHRHARRERRCGPWDWPAARRRERLRPQRAATSPAAGAAAGNAPAESAPASDVPAWLGEAPAITDARLRLRPSTARCSSSAPAARASWLRTSPPWREPRPCSSRSSTRERACAARPSAPWARASSRKPASTSTRRRSATIWCTTP